MNGSEIFIPKIPSMSIMDIVKCFDGFIKFSFIKISPSNHKIIIVNPFVMFFSSYIHGVALDYDRTFFNRFVHIRMNDYKNFTVCGQDTLLPMSYYKDQIEWFIQNRKDCFFIFLGDDTKSFSDEFQYVENKMISSNNHFGTDLAIMSQCDSAILSPSSFSWWGSYMMRERETVFAPKFWLGFRSKIEYQAQGVPSYSKEVEIF